MTVLRAMEWERIRKRPEDRAGANLLDYEEYARTFSWAQARALLDGLPGGGLNIAHEAVDRHVLAGRGDRLALRWIGRDDRIRDFTYATLGAAVNRFANVLAQRGSRQGRSRLLAARPHPGTLLRRSRHAEERQRLLAPVLGLRAGTDQGPHDDRRRQGAGHVRGLLPAQDRAVAQGAREPRARLPDRMLQAIRRPARPIWPPPWRTRRSRSRPCGPGPKTWRCLHFTSGTTGRPKGAVHVHEAVVAHHITGRLALDLHPDDVFWCTADPGWVTGTSYGIISPLTNGATMIVDQAEFDAERWYRILQEQKVTVWYTAPTAIRMLMKVGADVAKRFDLSKLRLMASVGEPLNPEAVVWGVEAFGKPFHDNWWQTETGGIMISNYLSMDVKPGSMGRPLPGVTAGIVERAEGGTVREITEAHGHGRACAAPGLAVDDARLSQRGGTLSQMLRRRLVSHRRSRDARRRGLLLVRRPRGRRHQERRPSHRSRSRWKAL